LPSKTSKRLCRPGNFFLAAKIFRAATKSLHEIVIKNRSAGLLFVRRTCILLRCGNRVAADALLGRFLPRLGPLVATRAVSFFLGHYSSFGLLPGWTQCFAPSSMTAVRKNDPSAPPLFSSQCKETAGKKPGGAFWRRRFL
jgi:hypothetical protein